MAVVAVLFYFLGCVVFNVDAQIDVTVCGGHTFCADLPNSYCNFGSGLCECPSLMSYIPTWDGLACIYECGALTAPSNGAVTLSGATTTGGLAAYSCDDGYKLIGDATSTCVEDSGWSNAAPICDDGKNGSQEFKSTKKIIIWTFLIITFALLDYQ